MVYLFWDYVTQRPPLPSCLPSAAFSLVCSMEPASTLWEPQWRDQSGKELREASGQQPVRTWGPQSNSPGGHEACQQPHERAWSGSSPTQSWMTAAPADTLTAALWETLSYRIQISLAQSPDAQKLWGNKCLLFKAAEFGANLLNITR